MKITMFFIRVKYDFLNFILISFRSKVISGTPLIHKMDIALMLMDKTIATDPDKPQGTPSTDASNTDELVRPSSFCFKSLVLRYKSNN